MAARTIGLGETLEFREQCEPTPSLYHIKQYYTDNFAFGIKLYYAHTVQMFYGHYKGVPVLATCTQCERLYQLSG